MSLLDWFAVLLGAGGIVFFCVRAAVESAHSRKRHHR
jgi:hypothetical protein